MKSLLVLLVGFVCLLPGAPALARLTVVSTTQDPASITQAIGGDRVSVTALARGYQDPHFLEAKPTFMVDLNRADLLEYIGLDLEVGYLPNLITGARNPKLAPGQPGNLDLSQLIKPLDVNASADRGQGDVHPNGNPHYWLDPENARLMARGIAARLTQLDPAGKDVFAANLAAFEKKLTEKEAQWSARLAPLANKPILTFHRSWSYFAARYKLNVVGYVEPKPGIPPTPAHTVELLKLIPASGARIILMENFYDRKVPDVLAGKTGIKVVSVPNSVNGAAGAEDYFKLLDLIVGELEKAAK